ncbi:syntaxin-8-like isoform X1 [Babylonia areolata]|uniref:syntaxin-8-like isoform X1 n=1 Tax=Babylonia areolata TaxID=304850 RepID=UPI003FD36F03
MRKSADSFTSANIMASDSWLNDYEACSRLGQQIMEALNERNKFSRTSSNYTKYSANVRTSLRQFQTDLNRLKQNLMRASSSYHITQREVERRQRLLDGLVTKEKQIDGAFKNENSETRQSLLGAPGGPYSGAVGGGDPWGAEPDEFQGVSSSDLQRQQQEVLQAQDQGLEELSKVIGRQKQMAIDIGNEVDLQNELIDDITDHVDNVGNRIQRETRHISIVDRKSNTCGYYIVIILLFVAIIVIVAVPYHGKP